MKKIALVLILLCIATEVMGVAIYSALQEQGDLKENTVIELNGETRKSLRTELMGFYPGIEREYKITLSGEGSENYVVTLDFRGDKNGGALENYLTVTIETKDIKVEKRLKELLDGEELRLDKNASEITITYSMPEDTDNGAQGATADFYIELTAKSDD